MIYIAISTYILENYFITVRRSYDLGFNVIEATNL